MATRITVSDMLNRIKANWPEANVPEAQVMLGIIRLNDIVMESTKKIVADFGLTQAAFEVLATLRSLPKPRQLTPTQLSRSVLVTSGGMTKVLKKLEKDGLVVRAINKSDQRSVHVRLTEKGARRVERSMQAVLTNDKKVVSQALSPTQISQLGTSLLKALSRLEGE